MSKIQIVIDTVAGFVGAVLGFLYGELNGIFYALLAFMVIDYITGVIIAIINKCLSSEVGFKGIDMEIEIEDDTEFATAV